MKRNLFFLIYIVSSFIALQAMEQGNNKPVTIPKSDSLAQSKDAEQGYSPSNYIWGMTKWFCDSTTQTMRFSEKQTFEGQQIYLGMGDRNRLRDLTYQDRLEEESKKNVKNYAFMKKLAQDPSQLSQLSTEQIESLRSGASRLALVPVYFHYFCQKNSDCENPLALEQHAVKLLTLDAEPFIATLEIIARAGQFAQKDLQKMLDVSSVIQKTVLYSTKSQGEADNNKTKKNDREKKTEDNGSEESQAAQDKAKIEQQKNQGPEDKEKKEPQQKQEKPNEQELIAKEKQLSQPAVDVKLVAKAEQPIVISVIEQKTLLATILETLALLRTQINQLDPNKSQQKGI